MIQGGIRQFLVVTLAAIALIGVVAPSRTLAAAGVRQVIQFQGKVVNSNGTNVTDGLYDFVFKLYDGAASNSTALFTETWSSAALWSSTMSSAPTSGGESLTYVTGTNESTIKVGQILTNTTKSESVVVVAVNTGTDVITISPTRQAWANGDTVTNKIYVKNGIFQVGINSLNADLSGVDFNTDTIFVGVNFNADGEMKPRIQYTAVPYAMNARKVGGLAVTDTTGTFTLAAGKTLTVNNTITFSGTDSTTLTLPGSSDTLVGLAATQTLTGKTLTAPKFADGGFLADANGNELLILDLNASAVNELTLSNGATTVNPKLLASGETNVGLDFETKGTGTIRLVGTATQAAELRFYEDTDNGTNYTAFKVGTQAGDVTYTLPTADGTGGYVLSTNGTGTLSWVDNAGGTGAPTDATYLTLGTNASLSGERVLTGTTNQITLTDAGANGNLTLSTPQDIHTSATPQFSRLGLGGASASNSGLYVSGSPASGTSQAAVNSNITFTSGATTAGYGIYIEPATQAASFTMTSLYGLYIADATKGSGSTITTQYGLYMADLTSGTTNYGIYQAGADDNFFTGEVGVGTVPATKLQAAKSASLTAATPGTALGGIHISPSSTNTNEFTALTFGAADGTNSYYNSASAGIYVLTGTGGSLMYLATTDSNSAGSKSRMIINSSGQIGFGTVSPNSNYKFHFDNTTLGGILVTTSTNSTEAIRAISSGTGSIGVRGEGVQYDFLAAGAGTNYGSFTGGHDIAFADDLNLDEVKEGMIVSSLGEVRLRKYRETPESPEKVSLSATIPTVRLANTPNDSAVYGVVADKNRTVKEDEWYYNPDKPNQRFGVANAVGEGRMLVTNLGGDIAKGELITSSPISGYGMKQADDLMHSYTVAKATESVNWDAVTEMVEYNGQSYKVYLVAVTYTSG